MQTLAVQGGGFQGCMNACRIRRLGPSCGMDEKTHPSPVPKARPEDHLGRHREIVSDPLNLFIRRVPDAGFVQNRLVTLHNGHRVAWRGPES